MSPLVIALFLFVAALALLVIDVFLPTGGALIIMSIVSAIGAIMFGFQDSHSTGTWFVIATLAAVPAGFVFFVKVWPHTFIGKRMITTAPKYENWRWTGNPPGISLDDLIGEIGIVRRDLLPIGMVEINGVQYEASGDGALIDKDEVVVVTKVDMGVLIVHKQTKAQPADKSGSTTINESVEHQKIVEHKEPTSQLNQYGRLEGSALESLGIDSLEED